MVQITAHAVSVVYPVYLHAKGCHGFGCYNSSGIPSDNDADDNLRVQMEIYLKINFLSGCSCN